MRIHECIQKVHSDRFCQRDEGDPFGPIFMVFYNEEFSGDKGLKSNISLPKIVDQYDRDSRSFLIGCKQVKLTLEDVTLTFGLPINGTNFIMNKTYTLKDGGDKILFLKN